jgi:hypothetical protein
MYSIDYNQVSFSSHFPDADVGILQHTQAGDSGHSI